MLTIREALEAALLRSPDDITLHMAYADCLIEDGDPRGEWIRLCLERERPSLDTAEKRKVDNAIRRLRNAYAGRWMGAFNIYPVYPTFSSQTEMPELLVRWKRGWIDYLQASGYNRRFMEELAVHPHSRLLRRLHIHDTFFRLRGVPGEPCNDFEILTRLPLVRLEALDISDPKFNDRALVHLLSAPWFTNLRHLELSYCGLTDDAAEMLADHPHIRKLKRFGLASNRITQHGYDRLSHLRRPGVLDYCFASV